MKRDVVLSIRGRQRYADQEPEVIELVTNGTMEFRGGGWDISYQESELTGLEGSSQARPKSSVQVPVSWPALPSPAPQVPPLKVWAQHPPCCRGGGVQADVWQGIWP